MTDHRFNPSATPGDCVKATTCYMCACRCGIKVHLKDGEVRYIEGNRDHPVNKGVLCAKGSAGLRQHYSRARLQKPLLRDGPRGSGEFRQVEWDEALSIAEGWLRKIRDSDPKRLAFFTGRDQSQALTGLWASQFGTMNYAAHGGFCSVNMAAAGLYTIGGSFWEFGEPDWEHTRYFMMFGVAEDHDSNPIKMGLGQLKGRKDTRFVSVNPVRTGYSAIADEWLGITPGTDGLFILALIHELFRNRQVDLAYLQRYTNAPWLVIDAPEHESNGLFLRDDAGRPLMWNARKESWTTGPDSAALTGVANGPNGEKVSTVFELMGKRYLDPLYAPEAIAERCGIPAETIRRIARELAEAAFSQSIELPIPWTDVYGRRHEKTVGRPVAMHAMRGISAHANGFQTCRALHLLQMVLGSIDCPGGFRYKPPYPKPCPPAARPAGGSVAGQPLKGPPLGFVTEPDDLLVDDDGEPLRLDKAFSWEAPLSAHGKMHTVIRNAWAGDPYPVDTLFLYMANMSWNSSMNTQRTMDMLTDRTEDGEYRIPRIIYSDAYDSEMVAYADLVLPDTTYLERWDCISMLDRPIGSADGAADAIRQPVVAPNRDVRPFQDVLIDLGARLGLPQFSTDKGQARYPGGYAQYMVEHERSPGVGPLAGWRGDGSDHGTGLPNPEQLQRYVENGCFWSEEFPTQSRFYKFANADYLELARKRGWVASQNPIVMQIYSEPLARFQQAGHGLGARPAPERHRQRLLKHFDPLPDWYPAVETDSDYPLHALTQRPMAMYHSWGSQNTWLRQIHTANRLFIHVDLAAEMGLSDHDWVEVTSDTSSIQCQIQTMLGVNRHTVWTWNAIGKRRGTWGLDGDAPEGNQGFLLNHLIGDLLPPKDGYRYSNSDPVTGQAAWFDLKVRIRKLERAAKASQPQFDDLGNTAKTRIPA